MTRADATRVVVCAGGLGTRIASWARYIPKEFYPVDGRPGIVHLLEEIAALGPAEVVIVCHPYYDAFTSWARAALSQDGHASYHHAARLPAAALPLAALTVSFITQDGPYADITSVLNGAGTSARTRTCTSRSLTTSTAAITPCSPSRPHRPDAQRSWRALISRSWQQAGA